MTRGRTIAATAALILLFIAVCAGVFVTNMLRGDSYVVLPQREGVSRSPVPAAELVDINSASLAELMEVPGIGETRAKAIIEYREQNGPFQTTADVMQVKGIGEDTYMNMADYITVGEEDR